MAPRGVARTGVSNCAAPFGCLAHQRCRAGQSVAERCAATPKAKQPCCTNGAGPRCYPPHMKPLPIKERWARFAALPFPSLGGSFEIDDICLVSADSAIAGCISTFFSGASSGGLDSEREDILRHTVADLERVVERMPNEAEEYFRELLGIARAVIADLDGRR